MQLFGWTDQHEAARTGQVDALRGGAEPVTRDQFTPLHVAAATGHADAVQALLQAGVDAHRAVDKYRGTALDLALLRQHWPVARLLLDRGVGVDAAGATLARRVAAMATGARCKQVDDEWVTDRPVDFGDGGEVLGRLPGPTLPVKPDAFSSEDPVRSGAQSLPLCIALRDIERGDRAPGEPLGGSGTPLSLCFLFGHLDAARALVEAGAPVDQPHDDESVLAQAVKTLDLALVQAVLAAGAPVDDPGRFQRTPLMLAAEKKNEVMVRTLLAAGADPSHVDQFGKTAHDLVKGLPWADALGGDAPATDPTTDLLDAAQAGQLEAVEQALSRGADPAALRDGRTALHWAVLRRHPSLVGTLLDGGAPIDARASGGFTALLLATEFAHEAVQPLLAAGAAVGIASDKGTTPLHHAARHADAAVVRALLDAGADIEAVDSGTWRPLHLAVYAIRRDVVAALLSAGATPTSTTSDGWTPLMFAAKGGAADLVRQLREAAPALLDATNRLGETAAFLAAEDGHVGALEALEGADLELSDTSGKTALLVACANGHAPALRWLLDQGARRDIVDANGAGPEQLGAAHRYVLRALAPPKPAAAPQPAEPTPAPLPAPPPAPADIPMPGARAGRCHQL